MEYDVDQIGDSLFVRWRDDHVEIVLSRWHTRAAAIMAECMITTTAPGIRPHLHTAVLNLTSGRSQAECIKAATAAYRGPDWPHIIKTTCLLALDRRRMGGPVVDLSTLAAAAPAWRVDGWVPDSGVTLLYGDGGHGKSLLALYLAACVDRGHPFLDRATRQGRVLYVDYETTADEQAYQLRRLARGMEWTLPSAVLYHQSDAALADTGPELRYVCDQHDIDFVVIDSLGYAGAASNDPEPVIAVYRVLHTLNRPVLAVHHVAKADVGERTPFGSVYHRNSARSCIEIRRVQEHGDDGLYVGLYHTKANRGRPQAPIGARIVYTPEAVLIRSVDPKEIAGLAERVPISLRVQELLKGGALLAADIAEALDYDPDKLGSVLRRLKQRGKLTKLGDGRWELP